MSSCSPTIGVGGGEGGNDKRGGSGATCCRKDEGELELASDNPRTFISVSAATASPQALLPGRRAG